MFVLKELEPESWINNGSCYGVQLKPPGLRDLVEKVVNTEANAEHWSLKDRLALANDVLDGAIAAGGGPEGVRVGVKVGVRVRLVVST